MFFIDLKSWFLNLLELWGYEALELNIRKLLCGKLWVVSSPLSLEDSSFLGFLNSAGCLFLTVSGGECSLIDLDREGLYTVSVGRARSWISIIDISSLDWLSFWPTLPPHHMLPNMFLILVPIYPTIVVYPVISSSMCSIILGWNWDLDLIPLPDGYLEVYTNDWLTCGLCFLCNSFIKSTSFCYLFWLRKKSMSSSTNLSLSICCISSGGKGKTIQKDLPLSSSYNYSLFCHFFTSGSPILE